MELRAGTRLRSVVCTTEVMTVRAPDEPADLRCGGHPMVELDDDTPGSATIDPSHAGGTLLGKRYADDELGLEVLCVKAGEGSLSLGATPLPLKGAKPLPASD
jgi:hypothetical protein